MGITNKPVYINIARPSMYAVLYAKQSDVNRAFTAVFNNDGEAWAIPENAVVSIWYRGAAGEGNYTKGIEINGNTAVVPLIPQMLSVPGTGLLCIIINTAAGDQIGTWNIPYFVEEIPGGNSEAATEFYTAFSEIASEVAAYALEAEESARAAAASANEVSGTVNNKVSKSGDKMTGPLAVEDYLEVAGEAQLRLRLKDDNIFSISAGADDNIIRVTLRDKNNAFKTSYFLLNPDGTVSLAKDPAEATHAATKAYVDTSTVSINPQVLAEGQQAQARENIGAAPSGYGLGEEQATKWVDDCDLAVESGLYRVSAGAANSPIASGTVLKVEAFTPTTKRQTVMANAATASFVTRFMTGGVWGEWEWENPPMFLGIEYRTTERYEGEAVYAKRISYTPEKEIGDTANVTDVSIPHNIKNISKRVRMFGKHNSTYFLPLTVSGGGSVSVSYLGDGTVGLRTHNTKIAGTFYFDLYYTKTK